MHGHGDGEIALLEPEVAAALPGPMEARLFQGRDHFSRLERRQFRHRPERPRSL